MRTAHLPLPDSGPPAPASSRPREPAADRAALEDMLRHVPRMDLAFDGDCAQAIGVDLPVVVINLPHRTDRWQTLCRRASAAGLTKLIRAPAVEGARLPDSQIAALLGSPAERIDDAPRSHLTLTRPAIGCFLSHLGVWRWLLGTNLPRMLVLEDDAAPAARYSPARLRGVVDGIREEAGLVFLGCMIMGGLADRPEGSQQARILLFQRHVRLSHHPRGVPEPAAASPSAAVACRPSDQQGPARAAARLFRLPHRAAVCSSPTGRCAAIATCHWPTIPPPTASLGRSSRSPGEPWPTRGGLSSLPNRRAEPGAAATRAGTPFRAGMWRASARGWRGPPHDTRRTAPADIHNFAAIRGVLGVLWLCGIA